MPRNLTSALLPTITSIGQDHALGTAFLVLGNSRIYLVASEHDTTQGKQYHCVLPDQRMSAANVNNPTQWIPLTVNHFEPQRHQVILSFTNPSDETRVFSLRTPVALAEIPVACVAQLGDDIEFMGFWSRNPDVPATLRKGHVATEGSGDFLANMKILHGNSGSPVWKVEDGKLLGTAQKNLFDTINLATPIAGTTILETYSDLVVVTSLDLVVTWIASQP